jgi:hypothetical protein
MRTRALVSFSMVLPTVVTLAAAATGCALDPSATSASPGASASSGPSVVVDGEARKLSPIAIDAEAIARATRVEHEDLATPEREAALKITATTTSRSLRSIMTPVKDQGGRDVCALFAGAALIERYTGGDISEQCEIFRSGGEGGQNYYRVRDYLKFGVIDERLCTYDGYDGHKHVPANFTHDQLVARSTFRLTDLEEVSASPSPSNMASYIKGKIDAGDPVTVGFIFVDGSLSSTVTYAPAAPMCNGKPFATNAGDCAGHAITITGYNDAAQMYEFKNSWGTGWGNGGYGWMTYDYLRRFNAGPFITLRPHAYRSHEASTEPVYKDVFGREPQSWEVDAWETNLSVNGWTIPKMRAAFVANAQADDAIAGVYQGILGRTPAAWETSVWKTNLGNGWSIPSMRSAFRADAQHTQAIVKVYQDVLDRTPSQWEINVWLSNLSTDANTITTMRIGFADDAQTRTAIDNVYLQVLKRHATTAELDDQQLSIRDFGWSIPQLRASLAAPPVVIR